MFIPASSEFISLCKAQVALLTQGLGAGLSVVYLMEGLVEESNAKLIPVVVYPETSVVWDKEVKETGEKGKWGTGKQQNPKASEKFLIQNLPIPLSATSLSEKAYSFNPQMDEIQPDWEDKSPRRQRQIVLPLMHEGVVMGFLVTGREDRPWNHRERASIERIAHTLAIAYILDKRREWAEQQLVQQRGLNGQQQDLLDNLLHQFRNPLTALKTFGKLLLRRLLPSDANYKVAGSIVRESDRLQELLKQLDEIIDLTEEDQCQLTLPPAASLETKVEPLPAANFLLPRAEIALAACVVTEVLEPLIDSARAIAQERHLDLIAEIPANLPPVKANASALREVLSNLIDNALKYAPPGSRVFIQAGRESKSSTDDYQGIAVSNTGSCIPPQDLERLFERHYRGIQAETEIPGTGLGLAIAKELVEKMQGEIEVISPAEFNLTINDSPDATTSEKLKVGTTFIVWLRL